MSIFFFPTQKPLLGYRPVGGGKGGHTSSEQRGDAPPPPKLCPHLRPCNAHRPLPVLQHSKLSEVNTAMPLKAFLFKPISPYIRYLCFPPSSSSPPPLTAPPFLFFFLLFNLTFMAHVSPNYLFGAFAGNLFLLFTTGLSCPDVTFAVNNA